MTDMTQPKVPFGVGQSISSTFRLFFRRAPLFIGLALIPAALSFGLTLALMGVDYFDPRAVDPDPFANAGPQLAAIAFSILSYGLTVGLVVYAAYDTLLGNGSRVGGYIAAAFARLLPLVVVLTLTSLVIGIGMALFLVPGFWLTGVLSVVLVVVVLENQFFGAFGRSAALTKGYRWPLFFGFALLYVVLLVFTMVLQFGVTIPLLIGGGGLGLVAGVIGQAFVSAIMMALLAIWTVLAYARLREIKEGVGVNDLIRVFE